MAWIGDMAVSRRLVLGAAAGTAALGALAACDDDPPKPTGQATPPPLDPQDWASVRAQFVLDPAVAHFDAFVFASPPATVRAAIDAHRAQLDRDPLTYLHANEVARDAQITQEAAKYLGAHGELYLTDSTTMGLGLLYGGLALASGDEVLTTEHDFYSTHESLRLRAARDGVTVRRARLYRDPAAAGVDEMVGALLAAVTPKTRVVAVTWVHSSTGVRLPVREIATALAEVNRSRSPQEKALLCVDGVHGFGAVDAGPAELGCDFLVSGCHKWLFGPRGTGMVWGTEAAWQRFRPVIPPFDNASIGAWMGFGPGPAGAVPPSPGGYHAFEHRWALREAFAFHNALGRDRVAARTAQLAATLKAGLAQIPGLKLITPRSPAVSAGLVCCDIPGTQPAAAVQAMRAQGIAASATPYNPSCLRLGTSIVNSVEEVDRAVAAVRALS
ncbi:aminotransferase class V-fold PLP-dependent enzyme [Catellatospora sp. KI3]|uniref:aminotransferase class V-fold PLP-dependent enzyme n=1 Tax=Catellatospora sp. KI3 TaxID=3041620 RepID=UPI0024825166|nr:aminotransferase class V-fold PLP-dependent enzyme [Catellatospora sp. KI3]MDI1461874.1 aminotransferase class V-fold PLP-dependent enzyme [Catellatospora sp. KI3]